MGKPLPYLTIEKRLSDAFTACAGNTTSERDLLEQRKPGYCVTYVLEILVVCGDEGIFAQTVPEAVLVEHLKQVVNQIHTRCRIKGAVCFLAKRNILVMLGADPVMRNEYRVVAEDVAGKVTGSDRGIDRDFILIVGHQEGEV